jgi:hypothetical protein
MGLFLPVNPDLRRASLTTGAGEFADFASSQQFSWLSISFFLPQHGRYLQIAYLE